jgi:hypothetical protein
MAGKAPADCHRTEEVTRSSEEVLWGLDMLGAYRFRLRGAATLVTAAVVILALAAAATAVHTADPSLDAMKARIPSVSIGDRPRLCLEIAERQLAETDKLYAGSEDEKARAALTDVVTYSELARDYALQSHKHVKQTEIAVRGMARRLTEVMHSLAHEDQAPVQDAVKHLERVRDDLLIAMFPKGLK